MKKTEKMEVSNSKQSSKLSPRSPQKESEIIMTSEVHNCHKEHRHKILLRLSNVKTQNKSPI